jgi:hypothetical protein
MHDAQHYRDQAELCLEMARMMSNRDAAQTLRMSATQYLEKAAEIERQSGPAASAPEA